MPSPQVTTVLGAKYAVRRALGHGGMGSVFEVENLITGKRAALKRLHQRFDDVDDAESKRRVIHEARAMARIRHRNVVDVYDVFEDEGRVCLVMELLVGELLSARVARGSVPLPEYIGWLLAAMRGVAAAHAAGVTHRDIKPENIFLAIDSADAEPVTVVIDFGVSKLHATEVEPQPTTTVRSGVAMGTPRYVSYEQLRGLRDVDGRTDVYAFGVMLYEAIAGFPPYDAATFPEQAIRFLTSTPPELTREVSALPAALASLVHRCIARERDARPQSMDALVLELTPFAAADAYRTEIVAFSKRSPPRSSSAPTRVSADRALKALDGDAHNPVSAVAAASKRRGARVSLWLALLAAAAGLAFVQAQHGTLLRPFSVQSLPSPVSNQAAPSAIPTLLVLGAQLEPAHAGEASRAPVRVRPPAIAEATPARASGESSPRKAVGQRAAGQGLTRLSSKASDQPPVSSRTDSTPRETDSEGVSEAPARVIAPRAGRMLRTEF